MLQCCTRPGVLQYSNICNVKVDTDTQGLDMIISVLAEHVFSAGQADLLRVAPSEFIQHILRVLSIACSHYGLSPIPCPGDI